MITLELTNGKVIRLNLKNRDREQRLRNAWYAMSDVPKFRDKVYKIVADTGNDYELKVRDIKNCVFTPIIFDRTLPEVEDHPTPEEKTERDVDADIELPDFLNEVFHAIIEVAESLPEKQRKNLLTFIEGLKDNNVSINLTDSDFMDMASKAFKADSPIQITTLIRDYQRRNLNSK